MFRITSSSEYVDTSFNTVVANLCDLSILVSRDGFSFCVVNPLTYQVLLIKEYVFASDLPLEDVSEVYGEINYWDENLRHTYAKTKLMYATPRFTLVPDSLFIPEKAEMMIDALYMPNPVPETIKISRIRNCDIWCISAIPALLYNALKSHQPVAEWFHPATPICERMVSEKFTGGITQLIINKNQSFFELYIIENGQLTLFNQYTSCNKNDIAYYVVNTIEQLNLDTDKINVRLLGHFEQRSDYLQLLKKYITHVSIEKNPSLFHGQVIDKAPVHRYLNLLNLNLCES